MKFPICLSMALLASGQEVKREDIYSMPLEGITEFVVALNELAMTNTKLLHKHTQSYTKELRKDVKAGKHRENVHYYFLDKLEKALQLKRQVAIPYWNWTTYAHAPHLDPVFSNALLGRESDSSGCLTGNFVGFFAHKQECIKRSIPTSYIETKRLIPEFMAKKKYAEAKRILRAITNSVQTKFAMYDSRTKFPRDPLHYLLISFELKLLYDWQALHKIDIEDPKFDKDFPFSSKGIYAPSK